MEPQTYPGDRQSETNSDPSNLSSTLRSVTAQASEAADRFRHTAGEKLSKLQEAAGTEASHLKHTAEEYADKVETYIRAKPVKSAIVSAGAGVILGLLIRR